MALDLASLPAGPALQADFSKAALLDLSERNERLREIDAAGFDAFNRFVVEELRRLGACVGVGGYLEERHLYRKSPHFNDGTTEPRSVHLGIDLWVPAGTPVLAPLDGTVHSFAVNGAFLDYGATIILEHETGGERFWTLYGHLSRASLDGLRAGVPVRKGDVIARTGEMDENGGWVPHLHFQAILDLLGNRGDYPGVCRPSERAVWQARCPDPNLLLRLECLE